MNIEERVAQLETRLRAAEDQLEIIRLLNTYGPTETSVTATWTEVQPGQRIEEFGRWKEVFDRLAPARAEASCRSTAVFRNREDPHEVVVLFEFADLGRAREHMGSPQLRAA